MRRWSGRWWRALGHGARRRAGRPPGAGAPLRRVRPEGSGARGGDPRAGRRAVQYRLAQAARRHPLRQDAAARRPQDGKTGAWSTDSDVLETLAEQGVELARKVLDWRQLTKLKSTYTDALPDYINPDTGRVHTCYALASTSTGRLSSVEPNLQNIPVRTEEGRRIRTRLRRAAGRQPGVGRLQPDRAAGARPHRRHPAIEARLCRRPRHPRHDRAARCSACRSRAWTRWSAAAPRRSISASSTASRPSAWRPSSASAARKRASISAPISGVSRASATIWTRRSGWPASAAMSRRSSAGACISPDRLAAITPSAPFRSAPRSMRRSRALPPTSSAAPWPHARGAGRRRPASAHAAAGA